MGTSCHSRAVDMQIETDERNVNYLGLIYHITSAFSRCCDENSLIFSVSFKYPNNG